MNEEREPAEKQQGQRAKGKVMFVVLGSTENSVSCGEKAKSRARVADIWAREASRTPPPKLSRSPRA